jgi:hypothetical protein
MAEFNSPIGSKKFVGQPMRDVEVPDDSGYSPPQTQQRDYTFNMDEGAMRDFQSRIQPPTQQTIQDSTEIENQMRDARKAKVSGKERLSEGARRRIEMLVGMTRLTRTVEIEGNTYVLQTLKSRELRDGIVATAEFDGTVQFSFETAKQLLARSLIQVAGVGIDEFLNSHDLSAKLSFVEELDQALLNRLYSEYIILNKEAQDKYSIKTPEEAKEVIEDLKK